MKASIVAVAALVAVVAVAQPHRHQHQLLHDKRDDNANVVWVTETDYSYTTIDVTTTVWVSAGETPAPAVSSTAAATPTAASPAAFYQESSSISRPQSTLVQVASSSSPPATSSAAYVAPAAAAVYATPVEPATTSTPEPAPTTTTIAVAAVASPAAAAASPAVAAASSSYSGACAASSPCGGDITFYAAGLGACGWTNDGDAENVVALPYGLMGTQSNGNPYCGKTITITKGSKSTTALVVDKCMGCTGDSIDLSNKAFAELDDFSVGRTTATWHFN